MTRRTPAEIYQAATGAGLSSAAAVIAVAVALAESGGDDQNVGDVSLETGTWGPSVGVWQVRTLKAQTGTGSDRDISALQGNLARQAVAMAHISSVGSNWTPWTTYTRGTYRQFEGQATAAAAGGTSSATSVTPAGLSTTPVSYASDIVGAARGPVIEIAFAGAAAGLIVLGLVTAFKPALQRAAAGAERDASKAAGAAVLA